MIEVQKGEKDSRKIVWFGDWARRSGTSDSEKALRMIQESDVIAGAGQSAAGDRSLIRL